MALRPLSRSRESSGALAVSLLAWGRGGGGGSARIRLCREEEEGSRAGHWGYRGGRHGPPGRAAASGFAQPRPRNPRRNLHSLALFKVPPGGRFQTPGCSFF